MPMVMSKTDLSLVSTVLYYQLFKWGGTLKGQRKVMHYISILVMQSAFSST